MRQVHTVGTRGGCICRTRGGYMVHMVYMDMYMGAFMAKTAILPSTCQILPVNQLFWPF